MGIKPSPRAKEEKIVSLRRAADRRLVGETLQILSPEARVRRLSAVKKANPRIEWPEILR